MPPSHPEEPPASVFADSGSASLPPGETDLEPLVQLLRGKRGARGRAAEAEGAGRAVGEYRLKRLLGQGGMGQVWEAEQPRLGRRVALKLIRPDFLDGRALELFEREARASARLQHPAIVTVHGTGEDGGRRWISQELVPGGRTLKDFVEETRRGGRLPRAYDRDVARLFQELAAALQTAHEHGIVHRDLKPGNVLLTPEGRPKITDFGLAQIQDEETLARSGDLFGTVPYMSPEQVAGSRGRIDARSDVFSLGVVLYELLTLERPFRGDTGVQIAGQILHAEPPNPRTLRSRVPLDLAVICARALEKEPERRYPDMAALGEDLRRFLADEPILARPPGPLRRARKWARRHPTVSATLALGLAALVVISISLRNTVEARDVAARRADEIQKLLDAAQPAYLRARADALWPPGPALQPRCESWLADWEALELRLGDYRAALAELRASAAAWTAEKRARDRAGHPRADELRELEARRDRLAAQLAEDEAGALPGSERERLRRLSAAVDELAAEVGARRTYSFADPELQALHDDLAALLQEAEALGAPARGTVADVRRRLAFARTVEARSLTGPEARRRWAEAAAGVRDREACPLYGGLELAPQLGLLPLGRDPDSTLWEFAHLFSGEVPERDPGGRLVVTGESGIVLVLVPGGTFAMGAQSDDPLAPGHLPYAFPNEAPVHEVELAPYFLAKHELTQGQWLRCAGANPSSLQPDPFAAPGDPPCDLRHPVELVSWEDCARLLPRIGLALPTEAQWERAARAGSGDPWWVGDDPEALQGFVNLADLAVLEAGNRWPQIERWLDDGWVRHAPVDAFDPNPFGLHSVYGNVWEWCLESGAAYTEPPRPGDGARLGAGGIQRVGRGGGYVNNAVFARASIRDLRPARSVHPAYGVRPARGLD